MSQVSKLRADIPKLDFSDRKDVDEFLTRLRQHLESKPGRVDLFIRQNLKRFELDPSDSRAYKIVKYVEDHE